MVTFLNTSRTVRLRRELVTMRKIWLHQCSRRHTVCRLTSDNAWDIKQEIWNISGKRVTTRSICQSVEGNKDGLWTTAIAAAIMI